MTIGYYPVEVQHIQSDGERINYRFLYKPPGKINSGDLSNCITGSLRLVLFPDILVFACLENEKPDLVDLLKTNAEVLQSLERCSSRVTVIVCAIDKKGKLKGPEYIKNKRTKLELLLPKNQSEIYKEGLKDLFSAKGIILPAPSGFVFKKPSKRVAKFFLKAEEAFIETEHVYFLAYALLEKIAQRENHTHEQIETIYIDTMSISSLAYAVRELYSAFYTDRVIPRIVSFHSYANIQDIPKPLPGTSLCLISASCSMNMHREWLQLTHCSESEVITLLTISNSKNSEWAAHALKSSDLPIDSITPSKPREIRIFGERFSAEDAPLKKVLLRKPAHKIDTLFKDGGDYSETNIFSVMKKNKQIYVSGDKLLAYKKFSDYVHKEVMQKVSLSTRIIVYQEDNNLASKKIAQICKEDIEKSLGKGIKLQLISSREILKTNINKDQAILIVAAVIGSGTQLLSISRDLRGHTGARHYLAGFQICESIYERNKLEDNLCFSSSNSSITFSVMESIAIGTSIQNSYQAEIKLLTYKAREKVFLPSVCNGDLLLRPDFAYWKKGYDDKLDHSAGVLLTIAAILQRAREYKDFKEEKDRLSSDTFRQVLIDPENFARYNDGIIQSALLRSAHSEELDYSSDRETSKHMKAILFKMFISYKHIQGEAALEMALALRTGHLRLTENDMNELLEEVEGKFEGCTCINIELLKMLLSTNTTQLEEQVI